MKNIVLIISMIALSVNSIYAIDPPSKVMTFYNGLKGLQKAKSNDEAYKIRNQMAKCFYASENSGINLKMDDMEEMASNLYTMKLENMIYNEKSLRVDFTIMRTEVFRQPTQEKGKEKGDPTHNMTYISKTYYRNGQQKKYQDVVGSLISNGLITEMFNEEPGSTTVPVTTTRQTSIEQLRTRAAYYYTNGMYTSAYNCYEELMERAPTDGDAAYRIALLTFWRKGCKYKFSNKKAARKKALEYISIAVEYGNSDIKQKASNVKTNWEGNNIYF